MAHPDSLQTGHMNYAIATVSMRGTLIERLGAARKAGFSGIEFFYSDCVNSGLSMREIRAAMDDLGLVAESLQPLRGFEGAAGDERQAATEDAKRIFAAACALGAPIVGVCASERLSAADVQAAVPELQALARMADGHGLKLGYEALSWSTKICTLAQAWQVVELAGMDNLGIVIDAFHIGMRGEPVSLVADIPLHKILMVQLSDTQLPAGLPLMEVSRHHRCMPGDGRLPVAALMGILKARGYAGPLTLELFSDHYNQMPPDAVAARGIQSLREFS